MTDGLNRIIAQLEQQKAAIEHALAALHDVAGIPGTASPASAPSPSQQKPARRKVRFTPEGRRRLAEAMKRRWAVKRAASAVKKTGRKQRVAKKAADNLR
jgi:hypothetical protein